MPAAPAAPAASAPSSDPSTLVNDPTTNRAFADETGSAVTMSGGNVIVAFGDSIYDSSWGGPTGVGRAVSTDAGASFTDLGGIPVVTTG